jgi:RimJ/RimL family protein N-acetyltransferase
LTAVQQDLTLRPIGGRDELDLFCRFPYVSNGELANDLSEGRRRPEWMWLALRGTEPVARLAWWGRPEDEAPLILDILDLDRDPARVETGASLLTAAMAEVVTAAGVTRPPQYLRFVPPDWRADPAVRADVEDRMAVLERCGARPFVERLRLEWRAEHAVVPQRDSRLGFRPVRDDEEILALMTEVLSGTLDAHSREELTRMSPRESAADLFAYEASRGPRLRDWWRVAMLPDGEPVGFVLPSRNAYHPIIAYIGVVPEHRGHGYIDGLLAEGTRILAGEGAAQIRAATDVGNVPMARAFERAGYVTFEHQIDMIWD